MKFLFFIQGAGGGCDYTVGCNQKVVVAEAQDFQAAMKRAAQIYANYGGRYGGRIDSITVYSGEVLGNLDIKAIDAAEEAEEAMAEEEARETEERAEFERLLAKYGKS